MRALVVTLAPTYWALAGESGDALNGHSLTGGHFQQESHVEFETGEQQGEAAGRGAAPGTPRSLQAGVAPQGTSSP